MLSLKEYSYQCSDVTDTIQERDSRSLAHASPQC